MPRNNTVFEWGFKTKAENLSIQYREELGISKFKPLSAFELAQHLDIPIFTVDEAFDGNRNHPAYTIMNDPAKFNALWMPNEDGERIIIHNSNHSLYRQQSNLMHELAHIILGHVIPEEIGRVCMLYNLHYYNKKQEAEAKFLGACLQLTKPSILWVKKNNWSQEKISEYYTASSEMVRFRCNSIGNYRN
ncbi:ImmA/IrrE family metallo-endopeptidase [Sediminibacterium sp.]|uniref:ImmA/IrrE family metallo-endopeptidase n=1 Tax=Sediminibacterium sp. TaxID=1917865 RepID=UPI003F6F10DE